MFTLFFNYNGLVCLLPFLEIGYIFRCEHTDKMFFSLQEYSSLNYLDIVLDAFLTLNGTQENIGMQQSDAKVKCKLAHIYTIFIRYISSILK